jgi:hypothetical protein
MQGHDNMPNALLEELRAIVDQAQERAQAKRKTTATQRLRVEATEQEYAAGDYVAAFPLIAVLRGWHPTRCRPARMQTMWRY